jgi:Mg2+ and Co2+ transporter CorA
MYYISTYDKAGIRQKNKISQTDLQNEDKIWIDLEPPTAAEISQIQEIFLIDTLNIILLVHPAFINQKSCSS